MDSTQKNALRAVIDYLWSDEEENYESLEDDSVAQDNHIYRHLMELKSFLDHDKKCDICGEDLYSLIRVHHHTN